MRLRYSCSICKASNYFTPKAPTRADLQMKFGSDEVQVNCKHCGKLEKKHINKISGTADNRMILIGLGIGVIVGITVLLFYGFIGVTLKLHILLRLLCSSSKILSVPIFHNVLYRLHNNN